MLVSPVAALQPFNTIFQMSVEKVHFEDLKDCSITEVTPGIVI